MRLVAWNCCKGPLSKKLPVLESLGADVAVVSECPELGDSVGWSSSWCGNNPGQGLGILARPPYSVVPLPSSSDAAPFVLPVEIQGPCPYRLLGVWTQKEAKYVEGLRSVLGAYRSLFDAGTVVLAGDLNSNAIWDNEHRTYCHSDFVADMEARGVESSYHSFFGEPHGSETRATHHWRWNPEAPFHLDYCFVPSSWLGVLQNVEVAPLDPAQKLSDHLPLVVDLAMDELRDPLCADSQYTAQKR